MLLYPGYCHTWIKKKDLFIYVKYVVTDKEEDLEKSLFKIFYLFLKDKYDK